MSQSPQEELYEAEQIIDDILVEESDGKIVQKWIVKWKGYDKEDDNTFEPKSHLQHLEIWKAYEQTKHDTSQSSASHYIHNTNRATNNTNTNNKTPNAKSEISLIQQLKYIQDLKQTMALLSNNSADMLISQNVLHNTVNLKKMEKLVKSSEKKLLSKVSTFTHQQILEGIKTNHNSLQLYKECIKTFVKYIRNNKMSAQTLSDLHISHKLVELIKINDAELQYLCIWILDSISTNGNCKVFERHNCIKVLIAVIEQSRDAEIINNVVSILGNISQQNAEILIQEKNVFKHLLILCEPNTSIDTLIIIAQIISNVCKYKGLSNAHIFEIIKCLSVLVMYDIADILKSTIYAYNQIFTYLVLPNNVSNIDMRMVLNGGVDSENLKKKIAVRSGKDELLTVGCMRQWKIELLTVPVCIQTVIKGYYTPFGMTKIKAMKFNKVDRFVCLMKHRSDKIKSFDLILLCCIIASAHKCKCVKETLSDIIEFGVIQSLKVIFNGNCLVNDQRGLMLVCAILENGGNESVKMFMEREILFPLILKVVTRQTLDNYTQNCIVRALTKVLSVYKSHNIDVLSLIGNEIQKLKRNKKVMDSNIQYLTTLIHNIQ